MIKIYYFIFTINFALYYLLGHLLIYFFYNKVTFCISYNINNKWIFYGQFTKFLDFQNTDPIINIYTMHTY